MSLGASPRLCMKAGARSAAALVQLFSCFPVIFHLEPWQDSSEKMAPFRWESIGAHMVVLIAARL